MIRSGYHAEWDARMATNPARAEYAERCRRLAAALEPFRVAASKIGVAAADAMKPFKALAEALERGAGKQP